jgi:hypothetical protein
VYPTVAGPANPLAERLCREVAEAGRDMFGIAKEARDAGIHPAAVQAILDRGQHMRHRMHYQGQLHLAKSEDGKDKKVDPDVKARYDGLQAKAKRHGVAIQGELGPHHTHDHIDRLEQKLNDHVSGKQKLQAEHIEEGNEKKGGSKDEAERRASSTVNKQDGGGKKSGPGRKHH